MDFNYNQDDLLIYNFSLLTRLQSQIISKSRTDILTLSLNV